MTDYDEKCLILSENIRSSVNPVCFDTLVVGSGPVAMLIADLRYGGESAFSYQDGLICNAPLFFSIPGKPDQFKGHGSIVIGTGIQQSGLDFFGRDLDSLATEDINRHGVFSKKATGESLSSVLRQAREKLQMPILDCWVDKVEQYSNQRENWAAPEEFSVRLLIKWPDGEQKYIYGRHIDLCLGAGPARYLEETQMQHNQQKRALLDGCMCYLNETGFEAMARNLINKAAMAPDKPLRILMLNTHMCSSFIVQLIENPETIFGKHKVPKIEITWVDRDENFIKFGQSTYPDDKYLFEKYIKPGIAENTGHFKKKTGETSLRIFTKKDNFQCSYSETGELTAKWKTLDNEEHFDCFCLSLGQAQHKLHAQLVNEFGSFIPEFLYQDKLIEYAALPSEVRINSSELDSNQVQPSLVATRSPKGNVYCWGVAANTTLLGLENGESRDFCFYLNKKHTSFFAPNTHEPGSLAVVLNQLYQVYAMAMLDRPEFGNVSGLRPRDPLWHLVKYKQQCRKHVLYYASEKELADAITKSVLNVLGFIDSTKDGKLSEKYFEYYSKCSALATQLIKKRAELLERDNYRAELINEELREIFLDAPKELSEDPIKEFYEHFYRIYRYKTITEGMENFSVSKFDPITAALDITSDERKEIKQKLKKYVGAYRFGMNSVLDMNLLSMSEPRKYVISDHLPISIQTTGLYDYSIKLMSWNLLADVHMPNSFKDFRADYLNAKILGLSSFGYYGKKDSRDICDNFGLFFDLATFITSHPFYQDQSSYLRLLRPNGEEEQISTEEFEMVLNDWIVKKLDPEVKKWSGNISDEALQQLRNEIVTQIKNKGFLDSFKSSCVSACKLIKHIESMKWEQRLARLSENKTLIHQLKQQDFITLQECTQPEEFLKSIFGENWQQEYGLLKTKASTRKRGPYSDDLPGDWCVVIYKKSTWKLDEYTLPKFLALGNNNKPGILAKFVTIDENQALIVGSIHHPGGENLNQIDKVISETPDRITPFIINGDFNHTKDELSVPAGVTLTESSSSFGTMAGNDWDGVHMGRSIDLCLHSESLNVEVETVLPIDRSSDAGVVTFQLYSKETFDGYNADAALAEIKNITKLYTRLAEEAKKCNKKPPKLELVTLLIPNWDKEGNGFENIEYIEKKQQYIQKLRSVLSETSVKVVDFTSQGIAEPYELEYLKGLKNYGITADLMKNNAVIRHSDKPHIQIDTNTDILDYNKFYSTTIGQGPPNWKDALDVTAYNRYYLTVTNKVGFFAPESNSVTNRQFIPYLKKARAEFFSQSKEELEASKSRNAAYEEIFTVALERAGYVKRIHPTHKTGAIDQFHANVTDEDTLQYFGITANIAVVARQTWQKRGIASEGTGDARLKSLEPLKYGDANLNSAHISFIIRRYTGNVSLTIKPDHEGFLKLIDVPQDIDILTKYFSQIKINHPQYYLDLLRVIPNIEEGRDLLCKMIGEFLTDRLVLVNIDEILDRAKYIIKDFSWKESSVKELQDIFSKLQSQLFSMNLNHDPNSIFVQNLSKALHSCSSMDNTEVIQELYLFLKSIDDVTLDSRLSDIKGTIVEKLDLLLEDRAGILDEKSIAVKHKQNFFNPAEEIKSELLKVKQNKP